MLNSLYDRLIVKLHLLALQWNKTRFFSVVLLATDCKHTFASNDVGFNQNGNSTCILLRSYTKLLSVLLERQHETILK